MRNWCSKYFQVFIVSLYILKKSLLCDVTYGEKMTEFIFKEDLVALEIDNFSATSSLFDRMLVKEHLKDSYIVTKA